MGKYHFGYTDPAASFGYANVGSPVFTSGYDYEARRKRGWEFWKWQVVAVSRYALDGYKPMSHVEHDNLSKGTALGYAKLMNDANRRE